MIAEILGGGALEQLAGAGRAARLHAALIFTIVGVCAVGGAWALVALRRGAGVGGGLRGLMWVAELLVASECALGGLLWAQGMRPARPELHLIYAAVALATVPAALAMARGGPPRRAATTAAVALFFLCLIALRALASARP